MQVRSQDKQVLPGGRGRGHRAQLGAGGLAAASAVGLQREDAAAQGAGSS